MNISFKSILAAGLAGVLALACGRYDDSELRNKINDIEGRLARLEKLVEQANQDISALQVLTAGLDGKVYVTGFEELADGYRISFSNGTVATIRNGKDGADGHTPAIGIKKDTDEVYYWTVDGEWLLDAQGNKVRVNGKDGAAGADGITPQLKIEDGYWYVLRTKAKAGRSWARPPVKTVQTARTAIPSSRTSLMTMITCTLPWPTERFSPSAAILRERRSRGCWPAM